MLIGGGEIFIHMSTNSKDVKRVEKQIRRDAKKLAHVQKGGTTRVVTPKAAANELHIVSAGKRTPDREMHKRLQQFFSKKGANRYLWALCVADPFRAVPVPVPISITPGASAACPRMYKVTLRGVATSNSLGFCSIQAHADNWVQAFNPIAGGGNPFNQVPFPDLRNSYLGTSSATGGGRGTPVLYTLGGWVGDTATPGSNGLSTPALGNNPLTPTIAAGSLGASAFPDGFIPGQLQFDVNSTAQRYCQVALGLRCRPLAAPINAAGRLTIFQHTEGDTSFQTFSSVVPNCSGNSFNNMSAIPEEILTRHEVALANWPPDKWLSAAAIPNTTVCFGQWLAQQHGSLSVTYPLLTVIGEGLNDKMRIEFEAEYVIAFYGIVSWEANAAQMTRLVPSSGDELGAHVEAAPIHMKPVVASNNSPALAKQGAATFAQTAVDTGAIHRSDVMPALRAAGGLVEEATGMSVGEIIGEGIGAIAAMLL